MIKLISGTCYELTPSDTAEAFKAMGVSACKGWCARAHDIAERKGVVYIRYTRPGGCNYDNVPQKSNYITWRQSPLLEGLLSSLEGKV